MTIRVATLFRYPIKGCRRVGLTAAEVLETGIAGDRQYMVIDSDGLLVTQREVPALAVVDPEDIDEVHTPVDGPVVSVQHFKWSGTGVDQGDRVARRLSAHVGFAVRLVRFPSDERRETTRGGGITMYADAYPVLITTTSSLADLNTRLDQPVPMERFRPNVVLDGVGEPWVEDEWTRVMVGEVRLDPVKWCDRCVVTTVDQDTGVKGREPLKALGKFRVKRTPDGSPGIIFGHNAVPRTLGKISVGDEVEVS